MYACMSKMVLFIVSASSKTQWSALVTRRYMITMMVLLCYVNLSGMSLECIVIVLMNNSLLGGQQCTDYDNILQPGNNVIDHNRTAIIPRLNFTCNGRITNIRVRLWFEAENGNYPFFQVWRPTSVGSTAYNKIGEVQLQPHDPVASVSSTTQIAIIVPTGTNIIEVQSGDVVGYYHPPQSRYRVITRQTEGYILYQFQVSGSPEMVDLNNNMGNNDEQQPVIQFTISKLCTTFLLACLVIILRTE